MRKQLVRVVPVVAIAALIVFLVARPLRYLRYHRREVKVYFRDARGLRTGAAVRMAGVDIGSVASVRVRPDVRDTPAEVIMALQTPYALRVPKDASVSLETEGVLGPTFADIDITGASGPPLENAGVLKSKEGPRLTSEEVLQHFADIFKQKPCDQVRSETAIGKTSGKQDSRSR